MLIFSPTINFISGDGDKHTDSSCPDIYGYIEEKKFIMGSTKMVAFRSPPKTKNQVQGFHRFPTHLAFSFKLLFG